MRQLIWGQESQWAGLLSCEGWGSLSGMQRSVGSGISLGVNVVECFW